LSSVFSSLRCPMIACSVALSIMKSHF
jgi:hypothetical protein